MKDQNQLKLFNIQKKYKRLIDKKYSQKIKAPIYTPKERKPFVQKLINTLKSSELIREIESSSVTQEEKTFLIEAAKRHNIFDFHKIADYYAHSSQEMQELMEKSALVIIDFDKAIENGYVKLSNDIADQYLEEYDDDTE